MPRVTIPAIGDVMFPDNMSDAEIMAKAKAMQMDTLKPLPTLDPRDLPASELLKGGFSRGLEGLKGTAFDLIPALGASLIGKDEYAKQQMQEYQERMAAAEAANPTAYKSLKDIQGIGDVLPFMAETAGELTPDMLTFLGGTGLGTMAGKAIAKKAATKALEEAIPAYAAKKGLTAEATGALQQRALQQAVSQGTRIGTQTGLIGSSMALNVPDVLQSVYQDTNELHPGIALTIGPLVGLLDTYLPERILGQVSAAGKAQLAMNLLDKSTVVPKTWKRAFGEEIAKTVSGEALTEGAQQALQVAASQIAGDKKGFFSPDNVDSIIMASVKGAIGGFGGGALPTALQARDIRTQTQLAADRQAQQLQDQQNAITAAQTLPSSQVLTPQQEAAMRREEKQLAARQQIHGDLFGEPVPQRAAPLYPVGQEVVTPEATLAPAKGELDLRGEPVQGELDLQPREEAAPAQFKTVLDRDTLLGTGLKPQSGFFKQLLNKDVSKPKQQAAVAQVLASVRANPNLTDSTKQAIETVAMNAFGALSKQQEMFGASGRVLKGADYGRDTARPSVAEADRTSAEVPVTEVSGEPTEGAGEVEQQRVEPTGGIASESRNREAVQQTALTQEEQDALQQELAAEMEDEQPAAQAKPEEEKLAPEMVPKRQPAAEAVPAEEPVQAATPAVVETPSYTRAPQTLELLQNHIEQLKTDFRQSKDPETKRTILNEINNTQKDIDEGRYQAGRSLTVEERNQAEEDAKTQKRLLAKIEKARKAVRRAEDLSENSKEKIALRKAEAEYEAFEAEARLRADARVAALTGRNQVGPEGAPYTGDVKKLASDLRAALNKMGLSNVGLKLEKEIIRENLKGEKSQVRGEYLNNLIRLSLKNGKDFLGTLSHEAIHAMRDMGLFSYSDWQTLSKMAKAKWIDQYNIRERYKGMPGGTVEDVLIEEAVAEAFAHYQQQEPHVQTIIEKIMRIMAKIGDFFRGYSPTAAEDIFGKAASGKLAKERAHMINSFYEGINTALNSAEPKYQVAGAKAAINALGGLVEHVPLLNESQKNAWSGAVANAEDVASSTALSFAPLHALCDLADKVFPKLAKRVEKTVNEASGYENGLIRQIEASKEIIRQALESHPEQKEAFNKIVNESTIAEVDPTKPRSEYEGKMTRADEAKEKVWDDLHARYMKLNPAWQRTYSVMRNAYKQMFEEVKKAIKVRIDSTTMDKESKVRVYKDIMESLLKSGVIDPYFSLGREGDHWLASNYTDKEGQSHFTVEAFKSPREREIRRNEILKMDPNARSDKYRQAAEIDYRRAPASSFINSALRIMETNGVPAESIDEMMRLFVSTLPETALAKSFQRRTGREGYREDSIATFEKKMRNMTHQVTNMMYNPKLTSILDAMGEHTTMVGKGLQAGQTNALGEVVKENVPARDNTAQIRYLDEFKKRINYLKNPTRNNLGEILQSAAFVYTMGFNLSSALVQTANVPMIVAPYLKGAYPTANISKALGDATKIFMGSGRTAKTQALGAVDEVTGKPITVGMKVRQSLANYMPDSAMGKKFDVLIRTLNEQGQLNRSQLNEILQADINGTAIQKFKAMSGWILHHTERMNREVTMIATYNLEMERLKKPTKADIEGIEDTRKEAEARYERPVSTEEATKIYAANKAIYTNELTNGSISRASAPRIAQSALGKMFFMYKRYAVSIYYMLLKSAHEAFKGETPEARKAGMRQLGGVMGMTALMAGAQGIPFFGILAGLYNLFSDDDDDDLKSATHKAIGAMLYKGPIEYFTNLSIASRIGLSDLMIRDTMTGAGTTTFAQQVMQAVGGPVFGLEQNIERGFSLINNGHIERGVEALSPSALSNALKAVRYARKGTETLRGDPITGDVSPFNVVGQLIGFAPADYIRQMEINDREKGIDKRLSDQQSKLKQRYYIAKREGDFDGMEDIKDDLLKLGEKHPELEINYGTIDDILDKSVKAQDRATQEMINGVRYNKKRLGVVQADMAEYE